MLLPGEQPRSQNIKNISTPVMTGPGCILTQPFPSFIFSISVGGFLSNLLERCFSFSIVKVGGGFQIWEIERDHWIAIIGKKLNVILIFEKYFSLKQYQLYVVFLLWRTVSWQHTNCTLMWHWDTMTVWHYDRVT